MRPGEVHLLSDRPPFSEKDGAARVLDPVFMGLLSEKIPPFGVLFQNFQVAPW